MSHCYTVAEIRAAERPYLEAQSRDDELMRHAAGAVAEVAGTMLGDGSVQGKVLLLVGSGGNGGDALYAGRDLSSAGASVDAVLLGSKPHERALSAFERAGGRVLPLEVQEAGTAHSMANSGGIADLGVMSDDAQLVGILRAVRSYDLVIDGIVGIGGRGPLRPAAGRIVHEINANGVPVLAVDVPSGVAADTGRAYTAAEANGADFADSAESSGTVDASVFAEQVSGHVTATVTVTFGGLRYAHAISPACGRVVLRDISLDEVSEELPGLARTLSANAQLSGLPRVVFRDALWESAGDGAENSIDLEPSATDHKYSTGVVGIAAGSEDYPGAGQLCTTAAVRATSPAVIYVGDGPARARITTALPTVIARRGSERRDRVRVDAWVVGPGRGTGGEAAEELRQILATDADVVVDADALTVLAHHEDIRRQVRARAERPKTPRTILTPHAGEFERITGKSVTNPIADANALAAKLQCEVLLKGRRTVIANGRDARTTVIDSGSSWAATPGSGDVLAGLIGAWVARGGEIHHAAIVHARAAYLAAQTPYGSAPCSAYDIAESIREATAWFTHGDRSGKIRL